MNNKKIVGLLLAGSMLMSSFTALASVKEVTLDKVATDAEDKIPQYNMGDKITITTKNKEAVRVYKSDDEKPLVVWGVSKANADKTEWVYELQLPTVEEAEGLPTNGLWVQGEDYIVVAGDNDSTDQIIFKIADATPTPVPTDAPTPTPTAKPPVVYGENGIVIQQLLTRVTSRTWKDIFSFDVLEMAGIGYKNSDDVEIEVEVERGSSDISLGNSTFKLRYDGDTYTSDSSMPIKTTVGELREGKELSGYFYKTGTYYFNITVTDTTIKQSWKNFGWKGDQSKYNVEFKIVVGSGSSGGGSSGGTSINNGTYVPTTTGGIEVALNPSQKTVAGQDTKVTYTASFVTPNSFTVGVNINGTPVTHFTGYDPVYVKVPYNPTVADTTILVVKDQNGNIIPRSYYSDGYMYVNLKDTNGVFTIVENPVSFDDVSHEWAKTQINALAARTILQGVGDNKFEPDRSVTRAEFMKMIIAMFDLEKSVNPTTFNDVDSSKWYAPYLATAQEMKITVGYEDGSFRPDNVISREEMSTMLYRASETLSVPIEAVIERTQFADDGNIQDYAKVPVYKMQQARILQGVGDNRYDPQGECTRAQAAVAMYNMFVLSMKK